MFRLVKVLNGNIQHETQKLAFGSTMSIGQGCALVCNNGSASTPSATAFPEYISLQSNSDPNLKKINTMLVTEDMIFKVEITGSAKPSLGMTVALATKDYKMDAVTYNSSGKGTIVALDDEPELVYVRFRK